MHILGPMIDSAAPGGKPFAHISPANALGTLRALLAELDVVKAEHYRCHDLRRGHARDLQQSGTRIMLFALALGIRLSSQERRCMKFLLQGSGDRLLFSSISTYTAWRKMWSSRHTVMKVTKSPSITCPSACLADLVCNGL